MVVVTAEQLSAIKVGDAIRLRGDWGQVSQAAPSWFMVTWRDRDMPEMFKRRHTQLIGQMELYT